MKIIPPSIKVLTELNEREICSFIENIGRTCYKSGANITEESYTKFIGNILKRGHLSVIEHFSISIRIICDRGVTHELVRHRLSSYSQESTRYVNLGNTDIEFIRPCFWDVNDEKEGSYNKEMFQMWKDAMLFAEATYKRLLLNTASPQEARSVLPNSVKTEIVITTNLRVWLHILKLRLSTDAHPQMREIMQMIYKELNANLPIIFNEENIAKSN
jgi:thymidylate synthase (FAD)